jgi:hypothetical protein
MLIQLAATHERANSATFGTRAPRGQRERQEHLFRPRTYARLATVVSFGVSSSDGSLNGRARRVRPLC